MITVDAVLLTLPGLDRVRLDAWVAEGWVRPARREGMPLFEEIDVARCRLILELEEMEVGAPAMPVVLGLLDQLHGARRQLRLVAEALERERRPRGG